MMYGLSDQDIRSLQEVFSRHASIEKAILYGSRAMGNQRYNSDIDLTLTGEALNLSEQFRIEQELDDLLLPYRIDLSLLSSISNPDLLDHIRRVGLVFYERL
jgi:predicted nucleotidyltransferase